MEIRTIINLSELDFKKVTQFVSSHPNASFFQSPIAFHFFKSVENYQPFLFVALENDEIVGSLLAVVMQEGNGLKGYFSRRGIVWGGPLVNGNDAEITTDLLTELNKAINNKVIYTEFRNLIDMGPNKVSFFKSGYQFIEQLNYIIALNDLDNISSKIKGEKRRQIRKALREGATIAEAKNLDQVYNFYKIILSIYTTKVKKPLPSFDFFSAFFKTQAGIILLIEHDNQIIGGALLPKYNDTIYDWFRGGLDEEFKKLCPSTLAVWAGLEYGYKNKFKYYDFMGAGKPNDEYGVRAFKSQFGGELVNYGRFVRINNPLLYHIGKIGLKILGKLR